MCASAPLEIQPFVDRQAQQMAAQGIEAEFRRAEAHPFPPPHQPRFAQDAARTIGNADADGAAGFHAIRAGIHFHQHADCMAGPAPLSQRRR